MPIIKLTTEFITEGLICPPDKTRVEYCDEHLRGLYILVQATKPGQGAYYLRYKDQTGKTCHHRFGTTEDLTLAEARRQAKEKKAEIALGQDPKAEEKAQQAAMTFDIFMTDHYFPYVTPRKRSWKRDDELYRLRIKHRFGDKRLDRITRKQLMQFQTDLLAEGLAPATCNYHIKVIRHALNLAIEWQLLEKNPATRIPMLHEDNKVENYLNREELERLLTVLRTDENRGACQIALFLLSTGARLNEALQAQWEQIDQVNRVWRIPASNSKSKRIRSVPLNDSALEVLQQLETRGNSKYLFINPKTEAPYTTIQKPWHRLRKKAGLAHLRIHDLRHQYASFLVNSGRTLYEVQQILGHSDPIVTMRYSHLSAKTLQEAANSASDMIKEASNS